MFKFTQNLNYPPVARSDTYHNGIPTAKYDSYHGQ